MWPWPNRPSRNLPPVNYKEDSSDDETFASPRVPYQTRAGSPVQLAVPTLNDCVDEDLEAAVAALQSQILYRGDRSKQDWEESVTEGLIVGGKDKELEAENMPDDDNVQVDFEDEAGQDDPKAVEYTRSLKMEFAPDDVEFWFIQLENEMFSSGVKSQWLKRSVLVKNLPPKIQADVKALLILKQSAAPVDIYKRLKTEILRIHAPQQDACFKKALSRVLTGLPSQLGQQLINDICPKPVKLEGCCCHKAVYALWTIQLPISVRSSVANMEFTNATYQTVFESADKVFLSTKSTEVSAGVAAISKPSASAAEDTAQVAAFKPGGRKPQRNKPNKNNGSGGGSGTGQSRPKPNNTNAPSGCCENHKKWASDAWYCLEPLSCPWVNKVSAKPSSDKNKK